MKLNETYLDEINSETYFETIKCFDEDVLNLEYHKKRIADTIGKNINLEEYIYPPTNQLLKCKVIYNSDEILDINYSAYKSRTIKSFRPVYCDDIEYKYKSTNRKKIDELYEQKKGADEIIIIKNGLVTDTSIANIAILIDDIWYTPKKPLLEGTTKNRYIKDGILKEKDIDMTILKSAKKIALLNAMIDFRILEEYQIIED